MNKKTGILIVDDDYMMTRTLKDIFTATCIYKPFPGKELVQTLNRLKHKRLKEIFSKSVN
jgi:hypothetical protein